MVDKPSGWTSHDVVSKMRRLAAERSIGHLGTLDPMATGVLPLLLGNATRLARFFTSKGAGFLMREEIRFLTKLLNSPDRPYVAVLGGAKVSDKIKVIALAALAGSVKHARNHKAAGDDIVICQGSEGGGHTGDVGSIVLWPEVIEAVAPTPVLAAGGVGSGKQMAAAMVMGAAGVWTGSLWLTVEEANVPPKQMESYLRATSRDTVRSRSFTGKPCRLLKNDWTDAWDRPDTPDPLGMPLQMMVAIEAVSRGHAYPEAARDVNFNPAGQVIGRATSVRRTRDVVLGMVEEYIEAIEKVQLVE